MTKKRLFVDMDGTLARFHDQVNYLERMYEKDFFKNLEPFENMVSGLQVFMHTHPDVEVYILSARVLGTPSYCEGEKNAWLDTYLPEIDHAHRIFTEPGQSKAAYIPGKLSRNDYLLDDYNRGLNYFLHDGGRAIKCHNNINQRGLGQHGGTKGHMWMGPMVHTSDTPVMIAAELSQHMSLSYQLADVLSAYPGIAYMDAASYNKPYDPAYTKHIKQIADDRYMAVDFSFGDPEYHGFTEPLNAIRYLSGNDDFREYLLEGHDHTEISATAQDLRSVCFNIYQNADFLRYLRADRSQLAEDFIAARYAADRPIIGQISYLHADGKIAYSVPYFAHTDMQEEIDTCRDNGVPFSEEWFIPPPAKQTGRTQSMCRKPSLLSFIHHADEQRANVVSPSACPKPPER